MRPSNVFTLKELLPIAERIPCAVGGIAPRYAAMIEVVLRAAQRTQSPVIVQISQRERIRYGVTLAEFANEFYTQVRQQGIAVPVVLHLDHTREFEVIEEAIAAGFISVMVDASEKPFDENIAMTRQVVEYAHARGVSVEAELGKIGTTDKIETEHDKEMYTDPREAQHFVEATGIDALAVSVGTAHGLYTNCQPKIDYERLKAIRALTTVPLVLHGGSGVPPQMMMQAICLPGGGVSKVNFAADLEAAFLRAIGRTERMTSAECKALPPDQLTAGKAAVESVIIDKMTNYLGSAGHAGAFIGA